MFEEIDNLADEDRGFLAALSTIIADSKASVHTLRTTSKLLFRCHTTECPSHMFPAPRNIKGLTFHRPSSGFRLSYSTSTLRLEHACLGVHHALSGARAVLLCSGPSCWCPTRQRFRPRWRARACATCPSSARPSPRLRTCWRACALRSVPRFSPGLYLRWCCGAAAT